MTSLLSFLSSLPPPSLPLSPSLLPTPSLCPPSPCLSPSSLPSSSSPPSSSPLLPSPPLQFYAVIKEFILVTSGGDFVKTRSPSLDEILTETNPRSLTLLLEPPPATPTSPSPSATATLRETALHRQLVFRHCILHDSEGCRELLDGLPVMATKGCWLVLEYCHWLPNCHEVLTLITKVRGRQGRSSTQVQWLLPGAYRKGALQPLIGMLTETAVMPIVACAKNSNTQARLHWLYALFSANFYKPLLFQRR